MARPRLSDGWIRLTHELFAALMAAGFGRLELIVIREVLAQVYGPRKLDVATISPADISKRTGLAKSNVCRAVGVLVAGKVLTAAGKCTYGFNKDYDQWVRAGEPIFAGDLQAYCRHAKPAKNPRPAVITKDNAIVITKDNDEGITKDNGDAGERYLQRHRPLSPKITTVITKDNASASPPRPPIEERASERSEEGEEIKEACMPRVRAHGQAQKPDADCAQFAARLTADIFGQRELDGTADDMASLSVERAIRPKWGSVPPDVIEQVAIDCMRRGKGDRVLWFVKRCLAGDLETWAKQPETATPTRRVYRDPREAEKAERDRKVGERYRQLRQQAEGGAA